MRRVLGESAQPLSRAGVLPACVEIMLAVVTAGARSACDELQEITAAHPSDVLRAISARARGLSHPQMDDPRGALVALREGLTIWQELGAPYEVARLRVSVGLACRALGDEDTAVLEFEAARDVFSRLRARPDVASVDLQLQRAVSVEAVRAHPA